METMLTAEITAVVHGLWFLSIANGRWNDMWGRDGISLSDPRSLRDVISMTISRISGVLSIERTMSAMKIEAMGSTVYRLKDEIRRWSDYLIIPSLRGMGPNGVSWRKQLSADVWKIRSDHANPSLLKFWGGYVGGASSNFWKIEIPAEFLQLWKGSAMYNSLHLLADEITSNERSPFWSQIPDEIRWQVDREIEISEPEHVMKLLKELQFFEAKTRSPHWFRKAISSADVIGRCIRFWDDLRVQDAERCSLQLKWYDDISRKFCHILPCLRD